MRGLSVCTCTGIRTGRRPPVAVAVLLAHALLGALLIGPAALPSHRADTSAAPASGAVLQVRLLPQPGPAAGTGANAPRLAQGSWAPVPAAAAAKMSAVAPVVAQRAGSAHAAAVAGVGVDTDPVATPQAAAGSTHVAHAAPISGSDAVAAGSAVAAAARAALAVQSPQQARPDHDHCPPASYPALMRERGVEGLVRVMVRVSPQGRASEARVVAASGWRLFDEAAVQRALACRFVPARVGGDAVEGWVDLPVRFVLLG